MALLAALSWTPSPIDLKEAAIANLALARLGVDLIKDTTEDTPQSRQAKAVFQTTRDELLRDYDFAFAKRDTVLISDAGTAYPSITTNSTTALTGFTGLTPGALVGKTITGTGIPAGTTIVSNDATSAVMSAAATASGAVTVTVSIQKGSLSYAYIVPTVPVCLKVLEVGNVKENQFEVIGAGAGRRVLANVATTTGQLAVRYVEQVADPDQWDPMFKDALVLRIASKLAVPLVKSPQMAQFLQAEFAAIFIKAAMASSGERVLDTGEELVTQQGR